MTYYPDPEVLLVLKQVGYSESTLCNAVESFKLAGRTFPELLNINDKNFVLFLRARSVKEMAHVEKKIGRIGTWCPGFSEIMVLEEEGYWKEIIFYALLEFLTLPPRRGIVISVFALFRAFLRKREKLRCDCIESWSPSPYLKKIIREELQINELHHSIFIEEFKKSALTRNIENRLVPRYYFNFAKRNRSKIIGHQQL
jgi:hypothetical protein